MVEDAIDAGYRHIDCAFSHLNESEIGEAIKEKICQGVVKRGDLFIASKLWNTFHHPDQVEKGVRRSLDALGLEYLDIYLIHWPKEFSEGGNRFPIVTRDTNGKVVFSDADICDTWKAMEQLVRRGLVKSIGVSNFNQKQLVRLLSCVTIRPAVIRTEILPYTRYRNLVNFCRDNGIVVTAYSSLTPSDSQLQVPFICLYYISLADLLSFKHWKFILNREKEPTYLDVRKLLGVSKKYDKSVAQVILRWTIQKGMVVIPKSADNSKLAENLNIFDFYLTEEEMDNVFETNSNINDSGTAFL